MVCDDEIPLEGCTRAETVSKQFISNSETKWFRPDQDRLDIPVSRLMKVSLLFLLQACFFREPRFDLNCIYIYIYI